jgi:WS/DGAT/MGAT family acyltransferase
MEKAMRTNQIFPDESALPSAWNVVCGTLLMKTLPSEAALRESAKALALKFARLRAIAHEDGTWHPLDPESLDLSYHVHMDAVVDGQANLSAALDRIGLEDLDTSRPLWRMHVIPCSDPQGYSAVAVRVHHCIGDGVHLSQMLMCLTVKEDGTKVDTNAAQKKFEAMLNGGSAPQRCCRKVGKACASVPAFFSNVAAGMKPMESNSVWQRSPEDRRAGRWTGRRCVVMVPPHSLAFVKQCKDKAKVSVNDVLMGATAGAIRRYCESRNDPLFRPDHVPFTSKFRTLVPVALPKVFPPGHDESDKLTNNWCFVGCKMPVGEPTPLHRIKFTSREMGKLKRSAKPFVGCWMAENLMPKLPVQKQKESVRDIFANHSLVFSNVPGPQEALYVAGERLSGVQIVYYNALPQIIVLSMSGQVWLNLTVDPDVITDRESFGKFYLEELEELGQSLGVTASLQ